MHALEGDGGVGIIFEAVGVGGAGGEDGGQCAVLFFEVQGAEGGHLVSAAGVEGEMFCVEVR